MTFLFRTLADDDLLPLADAFHRIRNVLHADLDHNQVRRYRDVPSCLQTS